MYYDKQFYESDFRVSILNFHLKGGQFEQPNGNNN